MAGDVKVNSSADGSGVSARGTMSYEEFLARSDQYTWAEWVDGAVIELSPARDWHQDLAGFLESLFRFYVETRQAGVVRSAPFQMKTGPGLPGREPDVLFVAREHLDRLKETHLEGPADLVVEIISPESRARDRGEKFYEYEQGAVPECWLLDPVRKQAEFHRRGRDGIYRPAAVGEDGIYRSAVLPGLWLKVDWLWQSPLPPLASVLKEWDLL